MNVNLFTQHSTCMSNSCLAEICCSLCLCFISSVVPEGCCFLLSLNWYLFKVDSSSWWMTNAGAETWPSEGEEARTKYTSFLKVKTLLAPQHAFYAACLSFIWCPQNGKAEKRKGGEWHSLQNQSSNQRFVLLTKTQRCKPVSGGCRFNSEMLFTSRANWFCEQELKAWIISKYYLY